MYVWVGHVTRQTCLPECAKQFSTWVLTEKPQHPNQLLSHQRLKLCSYPAIPEMCCIHCHWNNREMSLIVVIIVVSFWSSVTGKVGVRNVPGDSVEGWTGSEDASKEEITGIWIPSDRDGGKRPRRRRQLSACRRPLGLCVRDALLISPRSSQLVLLLSSLGRLFPHLSLLSLFLYKY